MFKPTQNESCDFFQFLNIYSTHHSLSGNLGFKSLAFILFEILLLLNSCQNSKLSKSCNFKGKIIQGKPKICVSFFHEESIQEFSR